MTGWGGTGRIYYTDLSAGTSYWTDELPIRVAAGARGVNLSTPYGRIWAAEFINDYIAGAVYNLFAADQLYPVSYAQNYHFHLFVFDNRTRAEKSKGPKISTTLNTTMVQAELANLLPFATVTVSAKFSNVTDYPQLAAVVANATTKVKDPALSIPIVDARLVWNWLSSYSENHMTQFINATHTTTTYDIPGFLFAFQGNYTFAFTFKENIALREPPGSIAGVALGDMILVDQSNAILTAGNDPSTYNQPGKGMGFTRAAIHELGHMMGLNHPFIYDQTEDFTNSVMAYYPYSNTYSQFDKDTVLRGINDELLIIAQDALAAAANILSRPALFNNGLCWCSPILVGGRAVCSAGRSERFVLLGWARVWTHRARSGCSRWSSGGILFLQKEEVNCSCRIQPLSDMQAASPLGSCPDEMVLRQRTEIRLDQTH